MKRHINMVTLVIILSVITATAGSMDFGTADEAKNLLENAVIAIEQNKNEALAAFTAGHQRFKKKDLYVFCFDAETGEIRAHGARAAMIGKNVKDHIDKTGNKFGLKLFSNAMEGEIRQVDYMWPRPVMTEQSPKSSFITRVEGLGCGVGY